MRVPVAGEEGENLTERDDDKEVLSRLSDICRQIRLGEIRGTTASTVANEHRWK